MYDKEWYEGLRSARIWNMRALWAVYAHLGMPRSFVDFGCGDGITVFTARRCGTEHAVGVELSAEVLDVALPGTTIEIHDLSQPIDMGRQFELVWSCEVGEHLPEEAADEYVKTLTKHLVSGGWMIFTAATVGQGGYNHINCQLQEYWREKITAQGINFMPQATDRIRETWAWATGPLVWLPQNIQVFRAP